MFRDFLRAMSIPTQKSKGTSGEYCLIRWADESGFAIVLEDNIQTPNTVIIFQKYRVDFNGKQKDGTVITKGAKEHCERVQSNVMSTIANRTKNTSEAKGTTTVKKSYSNVSSPAAEILSEVKEDDKQDEVEESAVHAAVLLKLLKLVISGGTDDDDEQEVHKVKCTACNQYPIRSDRYKCLICEDLNLCASCFERRRESSTHKSGHAFAHFKSPGELFGEKVRDSDIRLKDLAKSHAKDIHESVNCDLCKRVPIQGLRFKCDACANYDLCEECIEKQSTTKNHKLTHPLIVVPVCRILQISADDIELGKELGKGAFGTVHKGRWISRNRTVACKVITVPNSGEAASLEKSFLKELSAYAELSGAYILKIYGFTASKHGLCKRFILIMEYMSRGSLSTLIQEKGSDISLRRRLDMARNIASGMRKIHEHKMIHRDIRPDNILVNESYVAKIGDMGIARFIDPLNQHTQVGCQSYMPPEFYRGSYDQRLDIFTFGLLLNELFTSKKHAFQPFVQDKIAFLEKSPIFDDLIARCTAHDPKHRPAAIEIEKTLDLYGAGFNEMVLKKYPKYMNLSTSDKDEIFIAFYEKFHTPATEFIRKEFPAEFLDGPETIPGVKVDEHAGDGIRIECPMQ